MSNSWGSIQLVRLTLSTISSILYSQEKEPIQASRSKRIRFFVPLAPQTEVVNQEEALEEFYPLVLDIYTNSRSQISINDFRFQPTRGFSTFIGLQLVPGDTNFWATSCQKRMRIP
jgi:hypothetical protein